MKRQFLILVLLSFFVFNVNSIANAQEGMIGEVKMFAGNFPPKGWAFCYGQEFKIAEYSQLYSVIGTSFGGDGTTTFALPDFRGSFPQGTLTVSYPEPQSNNITVGKITSINVTPQKKEDNTKELKMVGINYIICLEGAYPSRE